MAKKPTTAKKPAATPTTKAKRKTPAKKPAAKKKAAPKRKNKPGAGAPKGKATTPQPHGGAIGQPAFVPTEAQRKMVSVLAACFPMHGEHLLAAKVGISRLTLRKYFKEELDNGRADMIAGVASQVIAVAMDENSTAAKGNLEAQKFILARMGGWTTKVDTSEGGQKPYGDEEVDLSLLSDEELHAYGRLAAIAEGKDPEDVVGRTDG